MNTLKYILKLTSLTFLCGQLLISNAVAAKSSQERQNRQDQDTSRKVEKQIQEAIGEKLFNNKNQKVRLQFNSRDKLYQIEQNSYDKVIDEVKIDQSKHSFKAYIKLVDKAFKQEFKRSLSGKFIIYQTALAPTRDIKKGETISEDDLSYLSVYNNQISNSTVLDKKDAEGKEAKLNLGAGRILQTTQLKETPLVRSGKAVTIQYTDQNISLKASGVALGDGARGEKIRVRNTSSNKIVHGKVTGEGVVSVEGSNDN